MKFFALYFLLISTGLSFGQDSIKPIVYDVLKTNYKDYIVVEDDIYAITKGDSLVVWNIKSNTFTLKSKSCNAIAKNSKNEIFLSLTNNKVFSLKSNNLLVEVDEEESIYLILIDKKDDLLVVTNKSFIINGNVYKPTKNSTFYWRSGWRKPSENLIKPDVFFLDSKNRLWLGYDSGEWGGDMCFFDLTTKEFYCDDSLSSLYDDKYGNWPENDSLIFSEFPEKVKITDTDTLIKFPHNIYTSHIKGITEDSEGNFYTSESLMHFFINGSIDILRKTEYENFYKNESLKYLLENETSKREYRNRDGDLVSFTKIDVKEYLGPISYNPYNRSVYYYTNNGFFKIRKTNSGYDKDLILNPTVLWKQGLPNAVGYQMAIKKFEFIDDKRFVFLTNLNGLGYYDGNQVKYYK